MMRRIAKGPQVCERVGAEFISPDFPPGAKGETWLVTRNLGL